MAKEGVNEGVVVSARVNKENRAKLGELANANDESVNQLLGRLIDQHIQGKERTIVVSSKEQEPIKKTIKKTDKHPDKFPCPLCDAPLEYHKGWLSDEIKCSNPDCDSHGEKVLISSMGEREYSHLLNVRRREATQVAPKASKKQDSDDPFDWIC